MRRKIIGLVSYAVLAGIVVLFDRLSKMWAFEYLVAPVKISDYLSFDLIINRGVSWGMLHSESDSMFFLLSMAIGGIIMFLFSYTYQRWVERYYIIGESLVIAGAVSNLADRIIYNGVVDFISLSYAGWAFPSFNIADMSIVLGVFIMLCSVYLEPH